MAKKAIIVHHHVWPVDISEADKSSSLLIYYFGHHPANRFEFSRGRDIEVDLLPVSGLINCLAYPVLEVEGELVKADVSSPLRETLRIEPQQFEGNTGAVSFFAG